ncbi:MAG: restriction endonuclease subunit S [Pseudanabaena sp. M046S1SP1A06QC]|nr:restriction endonuclease subunit S [Pseudanabaena sp. M046S1SP1A06QC]
MKNYPKKTIGELCNIVKGETGIASAISGEYPLVVTAKDRKTSATYQFDTQAVCIPLVSSSGHGKKSLNYVHYQEGKFALGTILAAVIPKNNLEISADFLHQYLLFYKDIKIVPLMRGAANVSLAVKDIAKIEIPLPPINEQKDFIVFFNKLQKFNDELVREFDKQENYVSQLKQAILQEAIAGQLTAEWRTQNPMQKGNPDTDAAALLAKIKAEKQQLIADGKLKKEKPLAEIAIDEIPFSIPDSWVWCRLGDIIKESPKNGYSPKAVSHPTNIKTLKLGATTSGKFNPDECKYIDEYIAPDSFLWLKKNDILIQRSNSLDYVGVSAIYDREDNQFIYPDLMMKIQMMQNVSIKFSYLLLSSQMTREYYRSLAKGAQKSMPKINQGVVLNTQFPLPPLAEQKAIVEKVDRLMNIIDQLEQQIKHRKQLAEDLMQTVLREAFE